MRVSAGNHQKQEGGVGGCENPSPTTKPNKSPQCRAHSRHLRKLNISDALVHYITALPRSRRQPSILPLPPPPPPPFSSGRSVSLPRSPNYIWAFRGGSNRTPLASREGAELRWKRWPLVSGSDPFVCSLLVFFLFWLI